MWGKRKYTLIIWLFSSFLEYGDVVYWFFWNGNKYTSRYLETRERLLGMAVDFLMKKASLLLSNVNLVANFKSDSSSLEYQAVCALHIFSLIEMDWKAFGFHPTLMSHLKIFLCQLWGLDFQKTIYRTFKILWNYLLDFIITFIHATYTKMT